MRLNNAIYGGEISGHHYFRNFAYCDSGMIPWLLLIELLSTREEKLSELVENRKSMFPSTPEINLRVNNQSQAIEHILNFYKNKAVSIDYNDGISVSFSNWRFNLRSSGTEPLLRLNIEANTNSEALDEKKQDRKSVVRERV